MANNKKKKEVKFPYLLFIGVGIIMVIIVAIVAFSLTQDDGLTTVNTSGTSAACPPIEQEGISKTKMVVVTFRTLNDTLMPDFLNNDGTSNQKQQNLQFDEAKEWLMLCGSPVGGVLERWAYQLQEGVSNLDKLEEIIGTQASNANQTLKKDHLFFWNPKFENGESTHSAPVVVRSLTPYQSIQSTSTIPVTVAELTTTPAPTTTTAVEVREVQVPKTPTLNAPLSKANDIEAFVNDLKAKGIAGIDITPIDHANWPMVQIQIMDEEKEYDFSFWNTYLEVTMFDWLAINSPAHMVTCVGDNMYCAAYGDTGVEFAFGRYNIPSPQPQANKLATTPTSQSPTKPTPIPVLNVGNFIADAQEKGLAAIGLTPIEAEWPQVRAMEKVYDFSFWDQHIDISEYATWGVYFTIHEFTCGKETKCFDYGDGGIVFGFGLITESQASW